MTKLAARPLPTLAQWLGDGSRAEEFEDWVRDMLAVEAASTEPQQQQAARILKTLAIACVEALRIEHEIGSDTVSAVLLLPRLAAVAIMSATASIMTEEAPAAEIAEILNKEFVEATRFLAPKMDAPDGR